MRPFNDDCAMWSRSDADLAVMMSVVSSAYVYRLEWVVLVIISLIYRRKRVGERVLPCGMPCVIPRIRERA